MITEIALKPNVRFQRKRETTASILKLLKRRKMAKNHCAHVAHTPFFSCPTFVQNSGGGCRNNGSVKSSGGGGAKASVCPKSCKAVF